LAQVMLSASLGKAWQERELFHPSLEQAPEAAQQQYRQYLARRQQQGGPSWAQPQPASASASACACAARPCPSQPPFPHPSPPVRSADQDPRLAIAKTFVPPGRVLYLSRSKRAAPRGCRGPASQYAFAPRWCGAEELVEGGLVVAGSMFKEHFPDAQLLVLQRVADEARSGLRGVAAAGPGL
jgi:hypothetical protein